MKLTREEFQRSKKESEYNMFLAGIRSDATKEKYVRTLRKVLCEFLDDFFKGDVEQRCAQIVKHGKDDPEWTQDLLIQFSEKLKERTKLAKTDSNYLNPSSFSNYFKPIKKLFDMNNVAFSWKRIYTTFPENDNISDTRGWTRHEIHEMLKFASGAMDRAILLIASSSGIRSGGFELTWGDVNPIYRVGEELKTEITESEEDSAQVACAMIRIYKGSKESYPAFITPEAYRAIMDYEKEWTKQVGRKPKPEDTLFKREGMIPTKASTSSIKKRVERMVTKSGIRLPLKKGQRRYEVPIMNGFRRFWNKTCKESLSKDSPLSSLIKKEYMMGHRGLVALDRNYFKTHMLELAEEYLNAIPELTISDEERIKAENRRLRREKSEIQKKNEELLSMKEDIEKLKQKGGISDKYKKND
tara:strand:- start:5774 stop:7015 length:1242 start_codon:yes stop_codon:yes gene_type:complete